MNQALLHKAQHNNSLFAVLGDHSGSNDLVKTKSPLQPNAQSTVFSHSIISEDSLSESFELIKILRSHQQSGRWTVLIAPQNIPDKALLQCCAVDMSKVLVVHAKQTTDVLATVENALSQATCSAVVAWNDLIPKARLGEIHQLAAKSNCHFYGFNRKPGWTAQ